MINYYTVFDYENLRIGLAGSHYVAKVNYWRDILLVICILTAFAGFLCLILTYFKEKLSTNQRRFAP